MGELVQAPFKVNAAQVDPHDGRRHVADEREGAAAVEVLVLDGREPDHRLSRDLACVPVVNGWGRVGRISGFSLSTTYDENLATRR